MLQDTRLSDREIDDLAEGVIRDFPQEYRRQVDRDRAYPTAFRP